MRLVLNGKVNRTYVQSLCMMFFHGEKFPESEENPKGTLYLKSEELSEGISCKCRLEYDGKKAEASSFVAFNEIDTIERVSKSAVGKAVYEAGKAITGKDIPWGILTGIRPSKVAYELIKKHGEKNATEILRDKYLLSESKARVAVSVAKNEGEIIEKYGQDTCSMYISIPFCPTRCTYCSFISYATKKLFDLMPEYLKMLEREISEKLSVIKELGLRLVSIYIGGGTPTTLDAMQLDRLISLIELHTDVSLLDEFTIECGRPDTITKEKLEVLKKHNIERISVNPQSLNDDVLSKIGRKHTVNDFYRAFTLAKEYGFKVINTDLIAGLDGDNIESFKNTIKSIVSLNPCNVTVHSFSVKKSAQILANDADIYSKGEELAKESVEFAYSELIKNGYEPYYMYRQKNTVGDLENIGYSKKGCFGIYNVLMMSDSHTVFGVGAGATTKLVRQGDKTQIKRIFSPKYPYEYLQDYKSYKQEIIDFYEEEV